MRLRLVLLIVVLSACGSLAAAEPSAPATLPATVPSAEVPPEVRALIAQLGDEDFRIREQASQRLRAIGRPALDALKQAGQDGDPEIRLRALALVRRIERRPVPGPNPQADGRRGGQISRMTVRNGAKEIDVTEAGRRIHITQRGEVVDMTVTGLLDGQETTESYHAESPEQLKNDNPEAYALYERWGGGAGPGIILRGPMVIGGGRILAPAPAGDDLPGLRARLQQQMKTARLPDAQQQQIFDQLDKLDQLSEPDPNLVPAEREKKTAEFLDQCDALRKKLAELKLPDPGEALPPPAQSRLGIRVADVADDDGLLVADVDANSRASKLGLQSGDMIQKIGDKPVGTVQDLRREVMARPKGLTVHILRDGNPVKLEEKP